jgi:hypothetical protein
LASATLKNCAQSSDIGSLRVGSISIGAIVNRAVTSEHRREAQKGKKREFSQNEGIQKS